MGGPQPPSDISDGCSVINDNTLYVFTPGNLLSLPLEQNGKWSTLPHGVNVTGAQCVRAVPDGDASQAALWVVGGSSTNLTYPGLQRFFFANQTWETIQPVTPVTQNRQGHGSAYINSTDSIVVYAGSQDGETGLSTQTFSIAAHPPFDVLAYNSQAPPVSAPIMLPWDYSHAVMLGGATWNEEVWLFNPENGWTPLETNLTEPLAPTAQCTLMDGSDGSKVLEIYDLSAVPNSVTQVALLGPGGATAPNGEFVGLNTSSTGGAPVPSSGPHKRDLPTLNNWPVYNGTGAPTVSRNGYTLAQGDGGMTVIAGGSSSNPLEIFNQASNNWVNTTQFFGASDQTPLSTPSVIPATQTSTSAIPPTGTANAQGGMGDGQPKSRVLTVLGATLGAIFGVAAILLIFLLLLQWYRRRRDGTGRRSPFQDMTEKEDVDRLSFQDRGASYMRQGDGANENAPSSLRARAPDSLAIMTGKTTNHKRGLREQGSNSSLSPLVTNGSAPGSGGSGGAAPAVYELDRFTGQRVPGTQSPQNQNRGPQMAAAAAAGAAGVRIADYAMHPGQKSNLGQHERESRGWSRYFAHGEQPANLAHMPPHSPGRSTFESASSGVTAEDLLALRESERATDSDPLPRGPPAAPLQLGDTGADFDSERVSRVVTGSPRLAPNRSPQARSAIYDSTESDGERTAATIAEFPKVPAATYSGAMGPSILSDRVGWHAFTPSQDTTAAGSEDHPRGRHSAGLSSVYTADDSRNSRGSYIPRGERGPFFGSSGGKPPRSRSNSRPRTSRGQGQAHDDAVAARRNSQRDNEFNGRQRSNSTGLRKPSSVYPPSVAVPPQPRGYAGQSTSTAGVQGLRVPGKTVDDRTSTQTVWPGPQANAPQGFGARAVGNDDMSWLNLGQR